MNKKLMEILMTAVIIAIAVPSIGFAAGHNGIIKSTVVEQTVTGTDVTEEDGVRVDTVVVDTDTDGNETVRQKGISGAVRK